MATVELGELLDWLDRTSTAEIQQAWNTLDKNKYVEFARYIENELKRRSK